MDANVFVHGYLNPAAHRIRRTLTRWEATGVVFHMPALWRFEVTNAIYRNVKAGTTKVERGERSLTEILDLPVEYHDERDLHREATAIALRLNAGAAYDAHYLALAEQLELAFFTSDSKLFNAARLSFPTIELLPIT